MSAQTIWFSLAVLLVIGELMTGTFYLLMVAIGLLAGGLAA
ncbi:NfeD family protein, partial [Ralstonia insidiosa]|nr:NfeD family protein [Ralstonia insidiosa]